MSKVIETVPDVNGVNRIANSTFIKGDISSKSDIRVDGTVEGTVYSDVKVVVGEKAVIRGNIVCNNIDLWGRMEGNIYVKDLLTIKSTASVEGNVNVRRFQVEVGASVNGSFHMIEESDFDECVKTVVKNPA